MTSLAMVLHYVESLIPVPYVMPGAKLGLANVVALYAVLTWGTGRAVLINALRTVAVSLILGTFMSPGFILAFSGALLSALVMGKTRRLAGDCLSAVGLSVVGAVTHNIGQLLAAAYIVRQAGVLFYLPYLLLFAIPTGTFIGLVVSRLPGTLKKRG